VGAARAGVADVGWRGGQGGSGRASGGMRRRATSVLVEDTGGRKKNEKRI
jgi:hypothetical protein